MLRGAVIGAGAVARLRRIPSFQGAACIVLVELVANCDPALSS